MKAVILVAVTRTSAWKVAEDCQNIPGVILTVVVAGAFDVVVISETDFNDLGRIVQAIQGHQLVTQTVSMIEVIAPNHS